MRPSSTSLSPAAPKSAGGSVVVFGEVLCDLFGSSVGPLAEATHLLPRLGGAPANVAVQLARLGVPTTLITAVGVDPFGTRLRAELQREGVNVDAVQCVPSRRTGVTLVEVDGDGERRFFGFRENSADLSFDVDDLDIAAVRLALRTAVLLHTGTVSLRSASSRRATRALQKSARRQGTLVSLDVNLRFGMFPSLPVLLRLANTAVRAADIVKATREEAMALLGTQASDVDLATGLLKRGPSLVLLTFGDEGCLLATTRRQVRLRPSQHVDNVDATGAGDAFVGAALAWLSRRSLDRHGLEGLDDDDLGDLGLQAGLAGAAVVQVVGATAGMLTHAGLSQAVAAARAKS